jgi:hypothetical protein
VITGSEGVQSKSLGGKNAVNCPGTKGCVFAFLEICASSVTKDNKSLTYKIESIPPSSSHSIQML